MPLLTFDLIEGRTEQEIRTLLDAAHRAVLRAFEVPERDRYQFGHENKAHHMVIDDTGLGLTRSRDLVVVRVYTSPRSEAQKQRFFAILQEELAEHCGLSGGLPSRYAAAPAARYSPATPGHRLHQCRGTGLPAARREYLPG